MKYAKIRFAFLVYILLSVVIALWFHYDNAVPEKKTIPTTAITGLDLSKTTKILFIQDREVENVWETVDSSKILKITNCISKLSLEDPVEISGSGGFLSVLFYDGDDLIAKINFPEYNLMQRNYESYLFYLKSGAWTEGYWEKFLSTCEKTNPS